MRAPSWFTRRVKKIDADLDVEWLPREQKWAITQKLANTPSLEATTDHAASEMAASLLERGYQVPRPALTAMVYAIVAKRSIVIRVEEADGSPRPLDVRTLRLLEQMAFKRRNRTVEDWIAASDLLEYEAKRSRERAEEALWSTLANDAVFKRILSDTFAGLNIKHTVHGRPSAQPAAEAASA